MQIHRREDNEPQRDRFFIVRQILNIVFMLGAVVGVAFYLLKPEELIGVFIILIAMAVKMSECVLRYMK